MGEEERGTLPYVHVRVPDISLRPQVSEGHPTTHGLVDVDVEVHNEQHHPVLIEGVELISLVGPNIREHNCEPTRVKRTIPPYSYTRETLHATVLLEEERGRHAMADEEIRVEVRVLWQFADKPYEAFGKGQVGVS